MVTPWWARLGSWLRYGLPEGVRRRWCLLFGHRWGPHPWHPGMRQCRSCKVAEWL